MATILCLLMLGCAPPPMERALKRNVVVATTTIGGSGVIIQTGWVLTNLHLANILNDIWVDDLPAELIAFDKAHDLALLKTVTGKFKRLRVDNPKQGSRIFYVGNPGMHLNSISYGHVVYMDSIHTVTDTLPLSGMSGGGLYNEDGHLVGLNVGGEGDPRFGVHMAVHAPAAVIRKFLKENLK